MCLHVSRELARTEERLGLSAEASATRMDCRTAGIEGFGPEHSLTRRCDASVLPATAGP